MILLDLVASPPVLRSRGRGSYRLRFLQLPRRVCLLIKSEAMGQYGIEKLSFGYVTLKDIKILKAPRYSTYHSWLRAVTGKSAILSNDTPKNTQNYILMKFRFEYTQICVGNTHFSWKSTHSEDDYIYTVKNVQLVLFDSCAAFDTL